MADFLADDFILIGRQVFDFRGRHLDRLNRDALLIKEQPVIGLGPWRLPAFVGVVTVLAAALGVPAWTLLRWTLDGVSRPGAPAEIATAAGWTLWPGSTPT